MGWSFGKVPPLTSGGYLQGVATAAASPLARSIASELTAGALNPGLCVGSMHLRDLKGHYPAGTYVITYCSAAQGRCECGAALTAMEPSKRIWTM